MAANVSLVFYQHLPLDADRTYELLCNWDDHVRWVPLTRVVTHAPHHFTAYTGAGPLRLKDEMVVTFRNDTERRVRIRKLGPVLTGEAGFSVRPLDHTGCVVTWEEHIRVPVAPGFTAPLLRGLTCVLFRRALRRLPPRP
jgi:hypothetical protein